MSTRYRHLFGVLFFFLLASCSGGGCSGCSGCAGTTPLPGGFPKDKAVDNAATVRVSRPGLDFLESSLPAVVAKAAGATGGKFTIPIPQTSFGPTTIFDYGLGTIDLTATLCPGGPNPATTPPRCIGTVDLGASRFRLDAINPDDIQVTATLPTEIEDTPVNADLNPGPSITVHVAYGSNGRCVGPGQSLASVDPKALPVKVAIPLVAETIAPRDGYTKIDAQNASVDLSAVQGNDVQICADCGPLSFDIGPIHVNLCNTILNLGFIKNFLVDQVKKQLEPQIKNLLADQLCTAPNPALNPPCPDGSGPDGNNKRCVYTSDKNRCVPTLLGTDAHIDLGGALKSISPSTTGGLDFGLAASGSMQPWPKVATGGNGQTPNGITLGMIGGALPKPPSKCVPQVDLKVPTGIPTPDELAPKAADAAGAPHIGIALAGRFLDYSMASVYDSGLLCLGVSTDQQALLKAGLLSLIAPSLKNLTFEQGDAAAAISTRPQAPPTIKIGSGKDINTDPLMAITLPKFAIDFYVWSYDRYVRAFTFTGDFTIPLNLTAAKTAKGGTGLAPTLGDVKIANPTVSNNDLLLDDPVVVANSLGGLFGAFSKQIVGSGFSPIDLSSALSSFGLGMDVAKIGKLTKGTDDFVGIFTNLSKTAGPATAESDTSVRIVSKTVPKDHMQLGTMTRDSLPELVVDVGSSLDDGARARAIEYAWWIDDGTRSEWTQEKHLVLRDDQLLLQGRHTLRVVSRVAGETATEDSTPAEAPFVIDALAPFVTVKHEGDTATIAAWDLVSAEDKLVARWKKDGAREFGEWQALAAIGAIDVRGALELDVEVKDEEGNVRQVQQGLRGRVDASLAAAGSGCGCSTPGSHDAAPRSAPLAALVALAGAVAVALRRRFGSLPRATNSLPRATNSLLPATNSLRRATNSLHRATIAVGAICAVAATSQGCACGSAADSGPACGPDCNSECKPPLGQGMPGSYTSVAKAKDGTLWVAGYNNALIEQGSAQFFGDLVVGTYDLGKSQVAWTTVDGIPKRTQGCADRPPDSWRNGETDSGEDVGLWTSIQISSEDHPVVTYYDATNHRLKLAWKDDDGWHTSVLRDTPPGPGDAGRYAKMILVDDKPVVAFLQIEPGDDGHTRSRIVVGRSHDATPHGADSFAFEDAIVIGDNPCGGSTCTQGSVCDSKTGLCTAKTDGCTPADCGQGKACASVAGKATCIGVRDIDTYPNVYGDYIALAHGASGALGIAAYDRAHGNLVGLVDRGGGKWDSFILDGETGSRADKTAIDTGDTGIGTSLAIDSTGTWNLSYVNGLDETLRYLTWKDGKAGKSEVVDDGSAADGKTFPDGIHLVGDDSTIRVDGDVVTIYYQDATLGTLRRAAGSPKGTTHAWDLRALPQPNRFAGFFPALVPGEDKVANFWEQTDHATQGITGDVTVITP